MERYIKTIKEKGYRNTSSRRKILKILFTSSRPLTPKNIKELIGEPSPDLSTIYRDLEVFQKAEIVNPIYTPLGTFFELKKKGHHGHLLCQNCQRLFCVPCPLKEEKPHQLLYWGKCEECRGGK